MSREIRGQALNRREPVRRGLGGGLFTKMGGALKNLALMSIVGGVSSEAGNAIYKSVSKPAADVVESGGSGAADGAVASGESAIPSTGELSTSSGSLSTAPTNGGPPTTPPTTSGSQPLTSRSNGKPPGTASTASQDNSVNTAFSGAEWQNPSQKRALGHDLPVNLFGKPYISRFFRRRRSWRHHYHWPSKPDPFRIEMT